jgi:hypothetical protein
MAELRAENRLLRGTSQASQVSLTCPMHQLCLLYSQLPSKEHLFVAVQASPASRSGHPAYQLIHSLPRFEQHEKKDP